MKYTPVFGRCVMCSRFLGVQFICGFRQRWLLGCRSVPCLPPNYRRKSAAPHLRWSAVLAALTWQMSSHSVRLGPIIHWNPSQGMGIGEWGKHHFCKAFLKYVLFGIREFNCLMGVTGVTPVWKVPLGRRDGWGTWHGSEPGAEATTEIYKSWGYSQVTMGFNTKSWSSMTWMIWGTLSLMT